MKEWNRFWFAPRDLFNVSLFRASLAVVLLIMYSIRFADIEDFYYNAGLLPADRALDILPEIYRTPWPVFFHSDVANYWAHVGLLVGLALLALGVIGRSLTWVVWLLHLGFMQRNFSLVYGADLFANFWLFYLCFIRHNDDLNVLHLWRRRVGAGPLVLPRLTQDILSTSFARLLQIQLSLSYAYTGIEKLKGLQWWEGTAFWYTLGMRELVAWDLTFLRQAPVLVGLLSMGPLLFEVYFPFAMMLRRLRHPWLVFGVLFHLGTALIMELWFFCFVMITCYLVFLDSGFLRRLVGGVAFRLRRIFIKSKG